MSARGTEDEPAGLTGGNLLARNAAINLAGQAAPILVALISIPLLIRGLGTERFGVLTLMWVVIGYFSLLDLGLGRALTQIVAERLGRGRADEVPAIAWTALAMVLALGTLGGAVAAVAAPWLIVEVVRLPDELRPETVRAMYLLALSLPAVASTAALRGILEAVQRFDLVNLLRLPLSIFNYAGPLLVLPFSSSLVPIIALLLAGRVVAWVAHLWLCLRAVPSLRRVRIDPHSLSSLVRFGSWTTVSNIISPLMVYLDRFLIGGMVSVTAVAYYVTPYEVVTKLWIVPAGLLGVVFPAIATTFAQDPERTGRMFWRAVRVMLLIVFPLLLTIVALAPEGLRLWLGADFAANSTSVLRWLAVGVLINCLGQVAYTVLQGIGRPDLTAKLHMIELPGYLVVLFVLVERFGIEGAAAAWVLRISVDTVALFILADRRLGVASSLLPGAFGLMGGAVAVLVVAMALPGPGARATFLAVALAGTAVIGWRRLLDEGERDGIRSLMRRSGWRADSTSLPP